MLKLQERFRSDSLNVFPEKVNEIVLSANNNKGIQSIDQTETYAYETNKKIIRKKRRN